MTFPPSLLRMIQASPSLSTLKLEVYTTGHLTSNCLDLDKFFDTLGTTFPNLRHFEHLAASNLDFGLVGDPSRGPSAVRSFFLQHPNIETLALDWSPKFSLSNREAEAVHSLFPALRHFSGPKWITTVLVRSPIRLQLESLNVLPSREPTSHNPTNSIIVLPRLVHLSFPAEAIYEPGSRGGLYLDEHSLVKYLRSAPQLVSLEIRSHRALEELSVSPTTILVLQFAVVIEYTSIKESAQAAFDYARNLQRLKLDLPKKFTTHDTYIYRNCKSQIDT
ncbi:hypothetical protein FRC06_009739, partial [Ceratobasidium sp. 370]